MSTNNRRPPGALLDVQQLELFPPATDRNPGAEAVEPLLQRIREVVVRTCCWRGVGARAPSFRRASATR
jgi:hypothetical protein